MLSHARDLVWNGKKRVGDLANHHVDFVEMRHRDNHFAVSSARLFQHIGMRGMAREATHVQIRRHLVHQVRIFVDDRDIMLFASQAPSNSVPNAARTANQNMHGLQPLNGLSRPDE